MKLYHLVQDTIEHHFVLSEAVVAAEDEEEARELTTHEADCLGLGYNDTRTACTEIAPQTPLEPGVVITVYVDS